MDKITDFGKYLRKLRIDKEEKLEDMAGKLDVSSAYLSAIELGKRNIPENMIYKIANNYELSERDISDLRYIIFISQKSIKVDMSCLTDEDKKVLYDMIYKPPIVLNKPCFYIDSGKAENFIKDMKENHDKIKEDFIIHCVRRAKEFK